MADNRGLAGNHRLASSASNLAMRSSNGFVASRTSSSVKRGVMYCEQFQLYETTSTRNSLADASDILTRALLETILNCLAINAAQPCKARVRA